MAIIVRKLQARPGQEAEAVRCLYKMASRIVGDLHAGPVVICRQTNNPRQVIWIGDWKGEADFERLVLQDPTELRENGIAESCPPLFLGFLDEFYRFPLPPFQVWALEFRPPGNPAVGALTDIFEFSRVARRDPHVVGMSLYRGVDDPGVFMGFLGLTCGFTPVRLLRNGTALVSVADRFERTVLWHPLLVACGVGRLRFPSRTPFWVRSAVSSAEPAQPGGSAVEAQSPPRSDR